MNLYREESSDPKYNAQRNLLGRTHYVDDDTLRYHKSRILATYIMHDGLLFSLIESVALDVDNEKRGFRAVSFDVFGTVISRASLEDACTSKEKARKAMWAFLNDFDAKAHTLKAIEDHTVQYAREMDQFRAHVETL